MNGKIPVFILFGPTASGKTALLFDLFTGAAAPAEAEVICADSMQVYRGMDIGTAKPTPDERARLPHHLLDIARLDRPFNAGGFVRLADECCAAVYGKNKLPVAAGGSGFYLKNFIAGLPETPPGDEGVRRALKAEHAASGLSPLYAELAAADPVSAARIHRNDAYRIIRPCCLPRNRKAPERI